MARSNTEQAAGGKRDGEQRGPIRRACDGPAKQGEWLQAGLALAEAVKAVRL